MNNIIKIIIINIMILNISCLPSKVNKYSNDDEINKIREKEAQKYIISNVESSNGLKNSLEKPLNTDNSENTSGNGMTIKSNILTSEIIKNFRERNAIENYNSVAVIIYPEKIDWHDLIKNTELTETFIFTFIDFLDKGMILKYQKHLSESTKSKIINTFGESEDSESEYTYRPGCISNCTVSVKSYYRKDGTYVRSHKRSPPGSKSYKSKGSGRRK